MNGKWKIFLTYLLLLTSGSITCLFTTTSHAAVPTADTEALMVRARIWYARDRFDLARKALDRLFRLDPNNAKGLVMLAEIELQTDQFERVKTVLTKLRTTHPGHPGITRIETLLRLKGPDRDKLHMAQLLARSGQTSAAITAFRELYPDGPPGGDLALKYWQLLGETTDGWKTARAGLVQLTKEQPENFQYQLALADHELSRHPINKKTLRTVINLTNRPKLARKTQAIWRSAVMRMDDTEENMTWLQSYVAQAPNDTGARDRLTEMSNTIEEHRRLLADPAYQLGRQGLELLETGDLVRAEESLQGSLKLRPNDVDVIGAMGYVRLRQGRHSDAQTYFEHALKFDSDNASKWRGLAGTAKFWGLLRKSRDALAADDTILAERYARDAMHLDTQNHHALKALGSAQYAAGKHAEAEKTWQRAIRKAQTETQRSEIANELAAARTLLLSKEADQLAASGHTTEAIHLLEQAVELDQHDPWLRLDLARLLYQQGLIDQGHQVMLAQVAKHQTDPESLYALALYQSQADLVRAANETLNKIPADEHTESIIRMQKRLHNQLAIIEDAQAQWLSGGLDWRFRKGSDGTSSINTIELPMELKQPYKRGRIYYRVDPISIDAGVMDLTNTKDASNFGSVLNCQPDCNTGSFAQTDFGIGLTTGYEWPQWRVDLGVSPLGFAVVRPVGGLRQHGDLGKFSYSLDFSSRPVTSSLLSYAGTLDPNSGAVWGGVQATGLTTTLSRDDGKEFGAWTLLGVHRFTGENVLTNDRVQTMAGAYWRVINEPNRLFSIGITGMAWGYSENAGEFTFGHGGYFSPSLYRSISLPVTYGERSTHFSYSIRAAISSSNTKVASAPYFPTDPGMQADAEARVGITGVDPYYAQSDGGGFGYTFEVVTEYKISPKLFLGSHLLIEKSDNYEPNRFFIYLRHSLDHVSSRSMIFPPQPYLPTADY